LNGPQELRGADFAAERGQLFTQEAERDVPYRVGTPALHFGEPSLQEIQLVQRCGDRCRHVVLASTGLYA
jgi:hypothetical protein